MAYLIAIWIACAIFNLWHNYKDGMKIHREATKLTAKQLKINEWLLDYLLHFGMTCGGPIYTLIIFELWWKHRK